MKQNTIYKPLQLGDRFNVAFPDLRIPSGYIDKTKTRVGITYTQFHDKRHRITIIPNVPIIDDAVLQYPALGLFVVVDGVRTKDVEEYFNSSPSTINIVSTPEGFKKVIWAAANLGKLDWLYKEVFLYLDEAHCYATEDYRKEILTPFNWVWKFEQVAFGSATPFQFSDPRFDKLQHYKLTYTEKFGKVTIINDSNPMLALNYMLTHPELFPGNVHIFFNSVTAIGDAIRQAQLTNVNIYCRPDEKNMENLMEAKVYYLQQPKEGEYKKFNFYSCRYNEGWALKDDEAATLMLVTDVNIPHSLIGIPFKGYQAIGRLNSTPNKIYHITNNFGRDSTQDFNYIQSKCIYNARKHLQAFNKHLSDCLQDNMEDDGRLLDLIKPFAKFNQTGRSYLDHQKVDQIICATYCKENYSNINTIEQTWQSLNYNTEVVKFDLAPIERNIKSTALLNKQVIDRIIHWQKHPNDYVYEIASETMKKCRSEFELLFQALEILGEAEIIRLEYKDTPMKAALIKVSNQNAEAKLRLMLIDEFKLGMSYTKQHMKTTLQRIYDLLCIKKPDGSTEVATAEKLNKLGLFELKECKTRDVHGELKPGFKVIKAHYIMKQAA